MKQISMLLFAMLTTGLNAQPHTFTVENYSQIKTFGVEHVAMIGDEIRVLNTNARYLIAPNILSGLGNADNILSIKMGDNKFANLQSQNGGYYFSQVLETDHTTAFKKLLLVADKTGLNAVIDQKVALKSSVQVGENIDLVFVKGGMLKAHPHTVTINGNVIADRFQIFETTNNPSVFNIKFENARTSVAYPEWWGAVGNNPTSDLVPIAQACNSGIKKIVFSSNNNYLVDAAIKIHNTENIQLRLDGQLTALGKSSIFSIKDASNITINGTGTLDLNSSTGVAIYISNSVKKITIDGIYIKNGSAQGLRVVTTSDADMIKYITIKNVFFENIKDLALVVDGTRGGEIWGVRCQNNNFDNIGKSATYFNYVDNAFVTGNSLEFDSDGNHAIGFFFDCKDITISNNHGFARGPQVKQLGVTLGKNGNLQNINITNNIMNGNGVKGDGYEIASGGTDNRNINLSNNISYNFPSAIQMGLDKTYPSQYRNTRIAGNIGDKTNAGIRLITLPDAPKGRVLENMMVNDNLMFGNGKNNENSMGIMVRGGEHNSKDAIKYLSFSNNIVNNFYDGIKIRNGNYYHSSNNLAVNNLRHGIDYGRNDNSMHITNFSVENKVKNMHYPLATPSSVYLNLDVESKELEIKSPKANNDERSLWKSNALSKSSNYFVKPIKVNNWRVGNPSRITIAPSEHKLSGNEFSIRIEQLDGSALKNVIDAEYKIDASGSVTIYSKIPFNGRVIISPL